MRSRTSSITAALLTAAALTFLGAASAYAQTDVDTAIADFDAGTYAQTYVAPNGPTDGTVLLSPAVRAQFDSGPDLPADWSSSPWSGGGTAEVTGGALVVDGASAGTTATYAPGRWLEFDATFGAAEFQHVGFGVDFNATPVWAMFSTGGGTLPLGLYARTRSVSGAGEEITRLDPTIDPLVPHRFRIDWTAAGVTYFIDGAEVAAHTSAPTADLRPLASDFVSSAAGSPTPVVAVDSLRMGPYAAEGTFTSRVFDAGDDRALWQTVTADAATLADTSVSLETRTGPSATPDDSWSTWHAVGSGGSIAAPAGQRYAQYRATLTTTDPDVTPELLSVTIVHEVDSVAPVTTIDAASVTGTTARAEFSSEVGASFECSLDGAPFQSCTSPRDYSGLTAGTHTIQVRATDQVGNVGAVADQSFTIAAPTTTIDAVTVTATAAQVEFSSDTGISFQCSLDGSPFHACTSPYQYSGLTAGTHFVHVRATDHVGNTGATAEKSFTIAASTTEPPATKPPGSSPPKAPADTRAPRIRPQTRSAGVSPAGKVRLMLGCPGTETRCLITLKLRYRGRTIATKAVSMHANDVKRMTLKLQRSARTALAKKGKLTVHALTTARDAAGNVATTDTRIKLRAK